MTLFGFLSLTFYSSRIWSISFGLLEFMFNNLGFLFKLLFDTVLENLQNDIKI